MFAKYDFKYFHIEPHSQSAVGHLRVMLPAICADSDSVPCHCAMAFFEGVLM